MQVAGGRRVAAPGIDLDEGVVDLPVEGEFGREGAHPLGRLLRRRPHRFDRTWESKSRYSMDWFYPVLTGVISGAAARERLAAAVDALA